MTEEALHLIKAVKQHLHEMADAPLRKAVLPNELIDEIISFVLPADHRTIVEIGDITTRTLLALTTVSRSVNPIAVRHLRHHCSFIDTEQKLCRLLSCLEERPYSLAHFTQVYLAPYLYAETMEIATMARVRSLLALLSPTLKRLVLDVPLYSKKWMKAGGRRAQLRMLHQGLVSLRQLEELVSISSDIGLRLGITLGLRTTAEAFDFTMYDIVTNAWWTAWPRLKRIALYASQGVLKPTGRLPSELEMVVSVGGLQLPTGPMNWVSGRSTAGNRPLKLLDVCIARYHETALHLADEEVWNAVDENVLRYEFLDVPGDYHRDDDQTQLLQSFLRRGALRGDLWDWQGQLFEEAIAEQY